MSTLTDRNSRIRCIDLFCGIGGFRLAAERQGWKCVFSSDIDEGCRSAYEANFGETPVGDIKTVDATLIPDHDVLLAGFPCQPFSICGSMKGFQDARGTLFFDIARIIHEKRPRAFVLENVKLLVGHNRGRTLKRILQVLEELGYFVDFRVLNALSFGVPQKRERVFILGFQRALEFPWPEGRKSIQPLESILEVRPPRSAFASLAIRESRKRAHTPTCHPSIWHENKSGHISSYPYSCALRAGASYNYLLVNGERRLTPREMLRLQGFPDSYKIVCTPSQSRKQAGNSVAVPVVQAVLEAVSHVLEKGAPPKPRQRFLLAIEDDIDAGTAPAPRRKVPATVRTE